MNREILIFRHFRTEGPGYVAEFLNRHGLPHRTIRIDAGDPVPDSIADCPGLVFMGGPMSVNDPLPWIPKVLKLIREAVSRDRPVLGHCLGGQLMTRALGGTVGRNRMKEIGWLPVQVIPGTTAAPWVDGLPSQFQVFHWHGETFTIPPGATHILRSRHCRNQGYVIGKSLALQCHIEMTPELVRSWARDGKREIAAARSPITVQQPARMIMSLNRRTDELHRVADRFYSHWIKGLQR